MSAESASALPQDETASRPFENRFLLVAVAAQRVLQIRDGARPRLDARGRKPCIVAVAEVLAGCVPYFSG